MEPRRRKQAGSSNAYRASWKGRILDFRTIDGKKTIKEVLVQHVWSHTDIVKHGGDVSSIKNPRCNCKYFACVPNALLSLGMLFDKVSLL